MRFLCLVKLFYRLIMAYYPQLLLCRTARDRCMSNLRQLPHMVNEDRRKTVKASVLIPLCVVDGEVCLLYTLRSSNLKSHSGQVSFPGGKRNKNETAVEAALRETEEEIGVPPQDVEVWGELKPVQGRDKNMVITPVVGQIKDFDMGKLVQNHDEVAEIFTVPMSVLCNPENHGYLDYDPPLPVYIHSKHHIWGITGVITHLFLQGFIREDIVPYRPDFSRKKFSMDELLPSKL